MDSVLSYMQRRKSSITGLEMAHNNEWYHSAALLRSDRESSTTIAMSSYYQRQGIREEVHDARTHSRTPTTCTSTQKQLVARSL